MNTPFDRRMILLMLTALINFIGVGILGPLTPALASRYGADALMIGLLATAYSAAQFIGVPTLGALSDRYGRRAILLLSLVGSAIGYIVFGIGGSLAVLFIGRVIEGLTNGNISTIFAYTADITSREQRTRSFGMLSAAIGVGLISGPLLGGALAQYGVAVPIYVVGALSLLNALLAFFLLPESLPAERRSSEVRRINPIGQIQMVLGMANIRRMIGGVFLSVTAMSILLSNLPVLMSEQFGWGSAQIANLYAIYGVAAVVTQVLILPRFLPLLGEIRLAIGGFVIAMIGYGAITLASGSGIAELSALSAVLLGIGNPLVATSLGGQISKHVAANQQGQIQGGNLALQTVGNVIGPIVGGWMFERLGAQAPYLNAMVIILLGITVIFPLIQRQQAAVPAEAKALLSE